MILTHEEKTALKGMLSICLEQLEASGGDIDYAGLGDNSPKVIRGLIEKLNAEDLCKKLDTVKVICYGKEKVWDSRSEAIEFYLEAMEACAGAEQRRYTNVYIQLIKGCAVCTDIIEED